MRKKKFRLNWIISILGDQEDPISIKKYCEGLDIDWTHVYLQGCKPILLEQKNTKSNIIKNVFLIQKKIKESIKKEIVILIHCAAGIHRTGFFSYILLRINGLSMEESMQLIKKIRIKTFNGVGDHRIKYAENLFNEIQKIKQIENVENEENEKNEENDIN